MQDKRVEEIRNNWLKGIWGTKPKFEESIAREAQRDIEYLLSCIDEMGVVDNQLICERLSRYVSSDAR